ANFINGELYGRATNASWAMQFPKELLENPAEAQRAVSICSKIDPSLNDPELIIEAARHHPQLTDTLRGLLMPRHPSQLYEAFFEGIVLFGLLWFVRTRMRQPNGVLTGLFFICYASFRIIVENFREPDAPLVGPFTRGQFLSFFLIAIGIGFIAFAKTRPTFSRPFGRIDNHCVCLNEMRVSPVRRSSMFIAPVARRWRSRCSAPPKLMKHFVRVLVLPTKFHPRK